MPARARLLTVAALVLLLAACSTAPPKKSVYYQDDGPPDRVPVDVAAIPDAQPRIEPPHRGSSKPYTALGRNYTPLSGDGPFQQRGMASWYGRQFHGNRTATGEIYDMLGMTAAHPTLPLPSYVRVTNVRNGRSVIVRVNDRGPFKHDRIIDLSYAAAAKLGIAATGTGEVEIERITTAQIASGDYRRGGAGASSTVAAATPLASTARASASVQSIQPVVATPAVSGAGVATGVMAAPALTEPLNSSPAVTEPARGWAVQLGAFAQEANADALAGRTSALLAFVDNSGELPARAPRVERDGGVYRVLVGTMSDRDSALSLARELERLLERPTTVLLR
jgi:rare lipoprotein A